MLRPVTFRHLVMALALAASLRPSCSRSSPTDDRAAGETLRSDLPEDFIAVSTEGACRSSMRAPIASILVTQRRDDARSTSVWLKRGRWTEMLRAPPASADPERFVRGVAPGNAGGVARLVEDLRGESTPVCIVYRPDQSPRAGDVVAVGLALQRMRGSEVLLFPESATE